MWITRINIAMQDSVEFASGKHIPLLAKLLFLRHKI